MLETVRTGIKGMAVMASRALSDLWSTGTPLGTGGTQGERVSLQPETGVPTWQCKAMADLTQDQLTTEVLSNQHLHNSATSITL